MQTLTPKNSTPVGVIDHDARAIEDGSMFETFDETEVREATERRARALANRATTAVTISTKYWLQISTGQSRPTGLVGAVLRIAREQGWSERGDHSSGQIGLWDVEPTAENRRTLVTALHQAGFNEVNVKLPEAA